MGHHRLLVALAASVMVATTALGAGIATGRPAAAATAIVGSGSSFAGIEFQQWQADTSVAPYNLNVNYQSSSSGQGRQDFDDNAVDFAVSDIRYDPIDDGTNIPTAADFAYVPVTAGGISFMYNLHGFGDTAKPIQLSSLTVCGIFGDAIQYWDDPSIQADNPGVALPHVPIIPVVRGDAAGTNYVLEEYCIATQPALYTRFITAWNNSPNVKGGGGSPVPTNQPSSLWPALAPITTGQGSDGVADTVAGANSDGYIGAVETGYAIQRHFPVAAVKNDRGAYLQPTAAAVAAALGHATQLADGTQQLAFTPGDPAAYNPSTYSYMLVRISPPSSKDGRPTSVGAAVTEFANYCLTIGQAEAPTLGYATINRNLIEFALGRLQAVPGYIAPTAAETAAIPSSNANTNPSTVPITIPAAKPGAVTVTTAAGSSTTGSTTASTASTTGSTSSSPGSSSSPSTASTGGSTAATTTGASTTNSSTAGSSAGSSVSGGTTNAALASVDPSASLGASTSVMAQTGIQSDLLVAVGFFLVAAGELTRRRQRHKQA